MSQFDPRKQRVRRVYQGMTDYLDLPPGQRLAVRIRKDRKMPGVPALYGFSGEGSPSRGVEINRSLAKALVGPGGKKRRLAHEGLLHELAHVLQSDRAWGGGLGEDFKPKFTNRRDQFGQRAPTKQTEQAWRQNTRWVEGGAQRFVRKYGQDVLDEAGVNVRLPSKRRIRKPATKWAKRHLDRDWIAKGQFK